MKINPSLTTISLLLLATSSALEAADLQNESARHLLSQLVADRKAPGVQYVFVDGNKILFQYEAGWADIRQKIPVTQKTTFNAYSVTKTFTAAAVVKLALEHKIDLDKPVDSYIKELSLVNGPTVRQTLEHIGGFPNPNPLSWIHRADQNSRFDEQGFVKQVLEQHARPEFMPGLKFAYSNVGYIVLGELVHQVSGIAYDDYVTAELIKPLKLPDDENISFSIDNPEQHARGYIRKWYWLNFVLGLFIDRKVYLGQSIEGWVPFKNFLVNGKAYGGLVGNASGFARYLQAILRREAPFTQAMLDTMWRTGKTNTGDPIPFGLGWRYGTLNGERYFTHTGGAGGYYCEIRIYPDARRASVIMINNTGISAQNYLDRIDLTLLPKREAKHND